MTGKIRRHREQHRGSIRTLFPDSESVATISGHGDTVTVGDTVDVYFHALHREAKLESAGVIITGTDGQTVYVKKPDEMDFLPALFSVGQVNGGWWRTFRLLPSPGGAITELPQ